MHFPGGQYFAQSRNDIQNLSLKLTLVNLAHPHSLLPSVSSSSDCWRWTECLERSSPMEMSPKDGLFRAAILSPLVLPFQAHHCNGCFMTSRAEIYGSGADMFVSSHAQQHKRRSTGCASLQGSRPSGSVLNPLHHSNPLHSWFFPKQSVSHFFELFQNCSRTPSLYCSESFRFLSPS